MTNQYSRKYKLDLDVFYREDATSWYLLGAYMTDGNIKVRPANHGLQVAITSKDKDWLELIRDLVCKELPLYKDKRSDCYRFTISSTELGRWFISKGCIPNKSLTLKFPNVPKEYMADFIRGCIDGDGCVLFYEYLAKGGNGSDRLYNSRIFRTYLSSASLQFIKKIQSEIQNLGIECLTTQDKYRENHHILGKKIKTQHPCYRVTIGKNKQCKDFLNLIYYPGHQLSMPRKRIMAQSIINFESPKTISKITRGAKLTIAQVSQIKKRIANGDTDPDIANDFHITRTHVRYIRTGKSWANIE